MNKFEAEQKLVENANELLEIDNQLELLDEMKTNLKKDSRECLKVLDISTYKVSGVGSFQIQKRETISITESNTEAIKNSVPEKFFWNAFTTKLRNIKTTREFLLNFPEVRSLFDFSKKETLVFKRIK